MREIPPGAKVLREAKCGCVLYEGRWRHLSGRWCEDHPYGEGSSLQPAMAAWGLPDVAGVQLGRSEASDDKSGSNGLTAALALALARRQPHRGLAVAVRQLKCRPRSESG